jgi:O-antigen biosynthesis protein WbqP
MVAIVVGAHAKATGRPIAARPAGFAAFAKRAFDLMVSLALLLALAPVMLVTALLVKIDSPGPAMFRQRRVGRGSAEFTIFKFRTMTVGTPDLASHLVGPGSSHVTRIGRFLRRTSLDELPQLMNILRGEMSLVGPRPALYNQDDLIAQRQEAGVDALRPGVTGWAQIHGRDDIPLDRKVGYDREYLERCGFGLDVWIVARTALTLFSSRGVF